MGAAGVHESNLTALMSVPVISLTATGNGSNLEGTRTTGDQRAPMARASLMPCPYVLRRLWEEILVYTPCLIPLVDTVVKLNYKDISAYGSLKIY